MAATSSATETSSSGASTKLFTSLAADLEVEARKFRGWVGLFTLLTLLGAVGIGFVASQETACDSNIFTESFTCDTETDGATFLIVAVSAFVAGMLFVLPLRGIARILEGIAALLKPARPDQASGESRAPGPAP